jgi:NTP pyrophosphatase (non-canonical NTP hydrolase)
MSAKRAIKYLEDGFSVNADPKVVLIEVLKELKQGDDPTFEAYEARALRTDGSPAGREEAIAICALGLSGESGEVCDNLKKWLAHGHTLPRDRLLDGLGDVLWYLTALTSKLGSNLAEVARRNVDKLDARYPHGFDPARSRRGDTDIDALFGGRVEESKD